jgi:hypothetical protein
MQNCYSSFLIFLFSLYSLLSISYAQEKLIGVNKDTTLVQSFLNIEFNPALQRTQGLDTSLIFFHRYNPAQRNLYNTLGNIGLAHQSLVFKTTFTPGFNFETNNFHLWELQPNDIFLFNTRIPYTDVKFVVGSNQEQYFQGLHSQNITPNWNFGFKFNKIRSDGYYQNQSTDVTNMALQSSYLSSKKKYGNSIKGYFNNLKLSENGGLRPDTNELQDIIFDPFSAPFLRNAKSTRISRGVSFRQFLNVVIDKDSIKSDEDTVTSYSYKVRGSLFHEFDFYNKRRVFSDDFINLGFYDNILFDSTRTFDSIRYSIIENKIGWKGFLPGISYEIYGGQQLGSVFFNHLNARDSIISNIKLGARLSSSNIGNLFWSFGSEYFILGTNRNDYEAEALLRYDFKRYGIFGAGLRHVRNTPDFIFNRYYSNHFILENNFEKTVSLIGDLKYELPKYRLKLTYTAAQISNFIFFNRLVEPEQLNNSILVNSIVSEKVFKIKKFYLSNEIIAQFISGAQVIRVPELVYRGSLFYDFIFRGGLKLQPGLELLYFSSFLADSYMPVTGQFYIQNRQRVGNYPFLDFFINMKIKQVRVFAKFEHLNYGFTNQNYLLFPNYPQRGRAFRIGLNWIFLN